MVRMAALGGEVQSMTAQIVDERNGQTTVGGKTKTMKTIKTVMGMMAEARGLLDPAGIEKTDPS